MFVRGTGSKKLIKSLKDKSFRVKHGVLENVCLPLLASQSSVLYEEVGSDSNYDPQLIKECITSWKLRKPLFPNEEATVSQPHMDEDPFGT